MDRPVLTLNITPNEALALRDALALSTRASNGHASLDPLWQQLDAYLERYTQQGDPWAARSNSNPA